MAPVRLGVVGAGSIGIRGALVHLAVGDFAERIVCTAVCDAVPGRAAAAAAKFGVPRAFDSLEELLACEDVDAVTLGTPIALHYDQALQAIAAGKHIHFNKTMTITTAEADEVIRLAARAGVRLVSSPGQMLRPHLRRIKQAVDGGEIGPVAWASTGAAFGSYHEKEGVRQGDDVLSNINPAWYWRRPGGGPLYDMTVYGLHSLTGILGPAQRVTAMSGVLVKEREFRGEVFPSDCDDNTGILIDFGAARFAFCYGTAAGNLVSSFGSPTIFGLQGSIVGETLNGAPLDYPGQAVAAARGMNAVLPDYNDRHPTEEFHVFQDILELADVVREGRPTASNAEHARHVIEIIESAYAAAETGQAQTLRTSFTPAQA